MWSVEVRILSGALESPANAGFFLCLTLGPAGASEARGNIVATDGNNVGAALTRREYPGVYPYRVGNQKRYRAVFRDSAGRQRQKRGFTSPTAAAKYRAKMLERADRGELRTTRQPFGEWFDEWLRGHHSAGAGTRGDYRRHGLSGGGRRSRGDLQCGSPAGV